MSESPFGFEPQDDHATPAVADEAGSRKPLVALLGLVVLGAAAGGYLLLGGGGDDTTQSLAAPVVKRSAVPSAEVPPAALEVSPVSVTPIGLNPFKALVVESKATGAGGSSAGASAAAPGASTAGTGTVPVPTPAARVPITSSPAAVVPQPVPVVTVAAPRVSTVELLAVTVRPGATAMGTFEYDGTRYDAEKGAVVAKRLEVVDLVQLADGTWVATLKVGDGSAFKVYEDQEVVVQ
jgi:hypothetical protein